MPKYDFCVPKSLGGGFCRGLPPDLLPKSTSLQHCILGSLFSNKSEQKLRMSHDKTESFCSEAHFSPKSETDLENETERDCGIALWWATLYKLSIWGCFAVNPIHVNLYRMCKECALRFSFLIPTHGAPKKAPLSAILGSNVPL